MFQNSYLSDSQDYLLTEEDIFLRSMLGSQLKKTVSYNLIIAFDKIIVMKVSVVIPVYNEEKYIKNCLDSLMKQEEKPDEIIVIDNNCTDNTTNVVKKYKNIKVIRERKQGIIAARNAGFDHAQGNIIARCDADTILPVKWVKNIKQHFLEDELIVAISMPILIHDIPGGNKFLLLFYLYMFIPRIIMGLYPLLGPSYAVKKSAWEKIKNEVCFDDNIVHEDIDLSFHIKKLGKIYHDKKTIVLTSGRRLKHNPLSFFGEYTLRFFKMLISHRDLV